MGAPDDDRTVMEDEQREQRTGPTRSRDAGGDRTGRRHAGPPDRETNPGEEDEDEVRDIDGGGNAVTGSDDDGGGYDDVGRTTTTGRLQSVVSRVAGRSNAGAAPARNFTIFEQ